uniref:Pentatricopeptide repeat-containing protein At2g21090-like n=1 Tax=Cicer arietinum TaxID=3827 RepID=A0A1S2Z7L1_CICAR|nr:pentatricopeptide repeat-containing protein At2g21090-like [Cicer arietinum]
MVVGYAHCGRFGEALRFYGLLRTLSIGYNEFAFASVLIVCVKLKEFDLCRHMHGHVLVVGFFSIVVVSSSIIDAYAKCGKMEAARRLFDEMPVRDIPAWTTQVSGFALCGDMKSAVECLVRCLRKILIGGHV